MTRPKPPAAQSGLPRKSAIPAIPRLLSVVEVASALQVSVKTTRRWIAQGDLRVHRLGRQLRISEEDLALFINRRRS